MERETQKLTTPAGKELVVKAWLTVGERREIQKGLMATREEKPSFDDFSNAQDTMIAVIAKSYDGSDVDVVKRLIDGKQEEYDYVLAEVLKVVNPLASTK